MSQETLNIEPPKIEFPCENYPIKVLGESSLYMHSFVIEIMERHAPGFDQTRITINQSSKGRFQSLTIWITATGIDQLTAIHNDLRMNSMIKMVM